MADILRGTGSNKQIDTNLKVSTLFELPIKNTFTSDLAGSIGLKTNNLLSYKDNAGVIRELNTADMSLYAPILSPVFSGTPAANTATLGTNTTQLATTAFVQNAINSLGTGSVTSVNSANSDILIANQTTTPLLTLNVGTGSNQIVKRDLNGDIVSNNFLGNATTATNSELWNGASYNSSLTVPAQATYWMAFEGLSNTWKPVNPNSYNFEVSTRKQNNLVAGSTGAVNYPTVNAINTALADYYLASNPSGYVTTSALSGYELLSNKSTSTTLGTSNTLYPTQNAVKVYVDSLTTNFELISNKSTSTSLGISNTLYPTQNAVKTYIDSTIAINGSDLEFKIGGVVLMKLNTSGLYLKTGIEVYPNNF